MWYVSPPSTHPSRRDIPKTQNPTHSPFPWVTKNQIYATGYTKILMTLLKYLPQALLNHRRRSTAGWSILQVLLDTAGGVLSLAQLAIDSSLQRDWRAGVFGNPVKLVLGNVSLGYDVVFLVQHFWLFGPGAKGEGEGEGEGREEDGGGGDGERRRLLSG